MSQMAVTMARPLRRLAWIGVGLLAALGAALFLPTPHTSPWPAAGWWLPP